MGRGREVPPPGDSPHAVAQGRQELGARPRTILANDARPLAPLPP